VASAPLGSAVRGRTSMPGCGVVGLLRSAFSVGGERTAESGKRKAECGKRKAESGKRKADCGKRKAESSERSNLWPSTQGTRSGPLRSSYLWRGTLASPATTAMARARLCGLRERKMGHFHPHPSHVPGGGPSPTFSRAGGEPARVNRPARHSTASASTSSARPRSRRFRRATTAWCFWLTRDSEKSRVAPISFRVICS